jgi:hypothetical protein
MKDQNHQMKPNLLKVAAEKKKAGPKKKDPAVPVAFKENWFPMAWMVFILLGPVSSYPHVFWNGMKNSSGPSTNSELESSTSESLNGNNKRKFSGRDRQRKNMRDIKRELSDTIDLCDSDEEKDQFILEIRTANEELKLSNQIEEKKSQIKKKQCEIDQLKFLYETADDPIEKKRIRDELIAIKFN